MAAGIAWLLNLDADVELGAIASGAAGARKAYSPKQSVREAMQSHGPALAAALLDPDRDLLVDDDARPGIARGKVGRAFCPTPRALRLLLRAGAEPEAHPDFEVLVRVNARAFASSLGTTLPGARFVVGEADAHAHLVRPPPAELSDAWRIKRNFGMAGRGQRVVSSGGPTEADMAFVRAGLVEGGVQIEPDVDIVDEFAIHGVLSRAGLVTLGPILKQRCDARGAWVSSEPMPREHAPCELPAEAERVAAALAAAVGGPTSSDRVTLDV